MSQSDVYATTNNPFMRSIPVIGCIAVAGGLLAFGWLELRSARGTVSRVDLPAGQKGLSGASGSPGDSVEADGDATGVADAFFGDLLADVRKKVDTLLGDGDDEAALRHVDEALSIPGLSPTHRQQLKVVKLGIEGRSGDHAGMLEMMDQIIAEDPASVMAARMREERPIIEQFHRLGPENPVFCETCGQDHPPGQHDPLRSATPGR